MSSSITHLEEIIGALERREGAVRDAATQAGEETLDEKLSALADNLARDRQDLVALCKRLRRHSEDPNRDSELTGHGDRNDPESDMGL